MSNHDQKLRELEQERAERFAGRFTLKQLEAIAKDTRLPGEIAGAYGVTAEIILRIQHKARASAARRRYEAAKDKAGNWWPDGGTSRATGRFCGGSRWAVGQQ